MRKALTINLRKAFLLLLVVFCAAGCGQEGALDSFTNAATHLNEGQYEEAAEAFEALIADDQYLAESYRGLGIAYLFTNRYAEACIAFEKCLLEADDQSAEFLKDVNLYLAFAREHHGEPDKALTIYNTMLAKESDPDVLYLRGRLYMEQGNERAAGVDFDRAVSMSSDYDLYINIYQIYEAADKNADGSAYLEAALTIANQEEENYYKKGLVNYYLQDYEGARDMLIRAIRQNESDSSAILLLGRVYLAMNDVADARAMFKEHINDEANAAAAYNGLALCDMAENNYEAALENVNAGLAYNNEAANKGLRFNEIVIYEHQKDWKTARAKATAYIAWYPADEAGLREYEFLQTR